MSDQQWGPPPGQPYQQPYPGPPQPGPYPGPPQPGPYGGQPQPGSYQAGPYPGPPGPGGYQGPPMGPPPGGPGYGWGPLPPEHQPTKKRGGVIALVVVGLAVLAVGGIALALNLRGGDEPTVTRPTPTSRYTPLPTATNTEGPFPTTKAPPTRPPTYRTTTSVTPPRPPEVKPIQIVANHRLYKSGVMPTVNCRESRGGLANGSKAAAYYRALMACLGRAWPRQLALSGVSWRAPGLTVFAGHSSSPCGGSDRGLSYYCSANHMIYMDASDDIGYFKRSQSFGRAVASHTVAHEYAHAMQHVTGILRAYYQVRYEMPNQDKKLEVNRRMELQASCLGNVFLGANRGSYPIKGALYNQLMYVVNNSGDIRANLPRDHGSPRSHGFWGRSGFNSRNPGKCNTFTASPAKVS